MKSRFLVVALAGLSLAGGAFAQSSSGGAAPVQGRGRGGAPYAWGDKNKDGICDITGKPVGQGRAGMMAQPGRGGAGKGRRMRRACTGAPDASAQKPTAPIQQ
jgi:hypothetical protein